jgi:hypothetical protein
LNDFPVDPNVKILLIIYIFFKFFLLI